ARAPAARRAASISSLRSRGDLDPRLGARLHVRVIRAGGLAVVPVLLLLRRRRRRRRRARRLLLDVDRRLLHDDRGRRVHVIRRRVGPVRRRVGPVGIAPPRTDANEDTGTTVPVTTVMTAPRVTRNRR